MRFRLIIVLILIFNNIMIAQTKQEKLEICSYLMVNKEIDEGVCEIILEKGKSNLYIEKITKKRQTKLGEVFFVKSLISGGRSYLYIKSDQDILLLGKYRNGLVNDLRELEDFTKKNDFTEYDFVTFTETVIKYLLLVHKNNSYIEESNKLHYLQLKK
ncbi:hypothetical protein [Paenimyroides viscosum]|uniref:Uncharacterized protein n=1 Tax=Paenimyroides viscosum TaxID=2488729 RepID=A0A3P1AKX5_9FLAO|nr:hypothetical protein [Paenimyroides viscosum]RRA89320.1 hypothetical protein EG242_14430 [Paenimyroides viscosum]